MARIRSIKPGFSTNEHLAELGPLAHLLFASLWPHCDREGRMEDRPRQIKVKCLPFYDCDINELLDALAGGPDPFILRYEVDGMKYIQVLKWHRHQTPYSREPESVIPPYKPKHRRSTNEAVRDSCASTESRNQDKEQCKEQVLEGGCKGEAATLTHFERFWGRVPKKAGKGDSARAYAKAVKALRERGQDDPHGFLLDRMTAFSQTPKAKGDFCPYPATWLNQGRYDDDPATWQEAGHSGGNRNGRRNDLGAGQRHDSTTETRPPTIGW